MNNTIIQQSHRASRFQGTAARKFAGVAAVILLATGLAAGFGIDAATQTDGAATQTTIVASELDGTSNSTGTVAM